MNVDDLKVNSVDLKNIGYMTSGNDIKYMLNLCVIKIENGELVNDREKLLDFLRN